MSSFLVPWKKKFWLSFLKWHSWLVIGLYLVIFFVLFAYNFFCQKRNIVFAFETSTIIVFTSSLLILLGGLNTPRFTLNFQHKNFDLVSKSVKETLDKEQKIKTKFAHKFFSDTIPAQMLVVFTSLIFSIIIVIILYNAS